MDLFNFIPGYETAIYQTGREPAFVMLVAFIITYILTRGYTRLARKTGWGSASFGGVHTHHMVFGLVMILVAGGLVFAFTPTAGFFMLLLAALFGSGAALVLDEFALLFHLHDVYWEKEGRKSIDAVVLAIMFGGLFLMRITPFGTETSQSGLLVFAAVLTNLPLVLIAAFKGKIFIALFGVFIPFLALLGAVRVAEPSSIWARKLYAPNGKKMKRSKERYKLYDTYFKNLKEKAWDVIGGKPGKPHQTQS